MRSACFIVRHFVLALVLFLGVGVYGQTSAFTYQGRLTDASLAPTGQYDFIFRLFNSSGTQLGADLPRDDVQVANGVFTVSLDFGFGDFLNGAAATIEIAVRPGASTGAYVSLTPRQPLTSAPYAMKSARSTIADTSTDSTQLGGVAASAYVLTGDARLSDSRNPLPDSGNYVQNRTTQQASTNFNISGNGTAGGTFSANAFNAATQYNVGGNRILSVPGTSNVFLGLNAGNANTIGSYNTFVGSSAGISSATGIYNSVFGFNAGVANSSGSYNSFFGIFAGYNNSTGSVNSFFGYAAGIGNTTGDYNTGIGWNANVGAGNLTYATAVGSGSTVYSSNTVVLGRGADTVEVPGTLTVAGTARVGSGNSSACDMLIGDDICFSNEQNSTLTVKNFAGSAYAPIKASAFTTASSIAYKKNVTALPATQYDLMLDRLIRLPLFTYRYKNESARTPLHLGLIAESSPASILSADGKGVDVYSFASLNAGATKALASQVTILTADNRKQKARIEQLEQQIREQNDRIKAADERVNRQQRQIDKVKKFVCAQSPQAGFCDEEK